MSQSIGGELAEYYTLELSPPSFTWAGRRLRRCAQAAGRPTAAAPSQVPEHEDSGRLHREPTGARSQARAVRDRSVPIQRSRDVGYRRDARYAIASFVARNTAPGHAPRPRTG